MNLVFCFYTFAILRYCSNRTKDSTQAHIRDNCSETHHKLLTLIVLLDLTLVYLETGGQ